MRQVIIGKTFGSNIGDQTGYPIYAPLRGDHWQSGSSGRFRNSHPWSVAGVFRSLYVEISHPEENPAGNGWPAIDFTVYINDAPTDLVVTVPAHASNPSPTPGYFVSSAQNTTDTATITPGDTVALGRGAGTIDAGFNQFTVMIAWSLTFESDNAGESGYGTAAYGQGAIGATNNFFASPLANPGGFSIGTDVINEPFLHSIVPMVCSLFRLDVLLDVAPGTGKHRTFVAVVNGVAQDGSGGTVNTTTTISDSATTGVGTFDLPLAVLDRLSICQLVSTSPASAVVSCSVGLRAKTDGQFALSCWSGSTPIQDGSTDFGVSTLASWAWSSAIAPTPSANASRWPMSELSMSLPGPIDPCSLSNLCVNLSAAPGSGKTYSFTTRRAFADTPAVRVMTNSEVLEVGSGEAGLYAFPTDRLDLQVLAHGTPAATQVGWTWLVTSPTSPPVNTTSYPIRRLRRFALPFNSNKWGFISRFELILQAGVGLSGTAATVQGYDPLVMFRLSRDGGQTWDDELTMGMGKLGEYQRRAFLNRLGRARNPVVEITSSDPVFVTWLEAIIDYEEGTS